MQFHRYHFSISGYLWICGLRDFEQAVQCEAEKAVPLQFDVIQKIIELEDIEIGEAKEPRGYSISMDGGVESIY